MIYKYKLTEPIPYNDILNLINALYISLYIVMMGFSNNPYFLLPSTIKLYFSYTFPILGFCSIIAFCSHCKVNLLVLLAGCFYACGKGFYYCCFDMCGKQFTIGVCRQCQSKEFEVNLFLEKYLIEYRQEYKYTWLVGT